jgi:hypothetical protein
VCDCARLGATCTHAIMSKMDNVKNRTAVRNAAALLRAMHNGFEVRMHISTHSKQTRTELYRIVDGELQCKHVQGPLYDPSRPAHVRDDDWSVDGWIDDRWFEDSYVDYMLSRNAPDRSFYMIEFLHQIELTFGNRHCQPPVSASLVFLEKCTDPALTCAFLNSTSTFPTDPHWPHVSTLVDACLASMPVTQARSILLDGWPTVLDEAARQKWCNTLLRPAWVPML